MALQMLPKQAGGQEAGAEEGEGITCGIRWRHGSPTHSVTYNKQGQMLTPKETGEGAWQGGRGDNGTHKKVT